MQVLVRKTVAFGGRPGVFGGGRVALVSFLEDPGIVRVMERILSRLRPGTGRGRVDGGGTGGIHEAAPPAAMAGRGDIVHLDLVGARDCPREGRIGVGGGEGRGSGGRPGGVDRRGDVAVVGGSGGSSSGERAGRGGS